MSNTLMKFLRSGGLNKSEKKNASKIILPHGVCLALAKKISAFILFEGENKQSRGSYFLPNNRSLGCA